MADQIRKVEPVPIFLDNPVDVDSLGVSQLAYTIAGAAIGNPGPLTIGVFGGWGQGKTAFAYSIVDGGYSKSLSDFQKKLLKFR